MNKIILFFGATLFIGFLVGCDTADDTVANDVSFVDTVTGDGAEVAPGDIVSIRYTVKSLADQEVFDSSEQGILFNTNRSTDVFTFVQGSNEAVEGLNEGILGMRGGGVREISIPFNQAWGRGIEGVVPAQADILFEVELLKRPTFTRITEGTGPEFDVADIVSLTFEADFYSTRITVMHEHDPYFFTLGRGVSGTISSPFPQVFSKMAGLHLVIQDMKVGDEYEVEIPPELGLGFQTVNGVPANSTIVATISTVAVN